MKGRISTVFGKLSLGSWLAMALILCGLVAIVPYLALSQDQSQVGKPCSQNRWLA